MKKCLPLGTSKHHTLKISKYVQSQLDSPGLYTETCLCIVPLKAGPREPVTLVVGRLVLR